MLGGYFRTAGGRRRGMVSVEAAFAFPALIAAAMMIMELANIALTIDMGETALQRSVQEFRLKASMDEIEEKDVRRSMTGASQGYVKWDDIVDVSIERFDSLDAMGGGADEDEESPEGDAGVDVPALKITVDIRAAYITSVARLLDGNENGFRYRYEEVLSYLPATRTAP